MNDVLMLVFLGACLVTIGLLNYRATCRFARRILRDVLRP